MNIKLIAWRFVWKALAALFLFALSACGSAPAQITPTSAASIAPTATIAYFFRTGIPLPTFTPSLTPPPTRTPRPTMTPVTFTPTPSSPFPLDGYVVVFKKDGDLYFQDENNPPVQLTHGGEESFSPMISDDNQRIVFTRGNSSDGFSNLYSVNSDGSGEREIITEQWLNSLGERTSVFFPVFVPETHSLAFNTRRCESQDYNALCVVGVFLADADSGEIREIIHPNKAGQYDRDGNFKVSPNGKMISVASSGQIDIFDMDGKVVRENVLPYTPSTPMELFPDQYWLPDSSGLIVALPDAMNYGWAYPTTVIYNVWRYSVENNTAIQMLLEPLPAMGIGGCGDVIRVSPNGNWILYTGSDSTYLGNLSDGHVQSYPLSCHYPYFLWSSNSKYFVSDPYSLVGVVGEPPIPMGGYFLKWIDANHFLYVNTRDDSFSTLIGEIIGNKILTYSFGSFSLIKPKQ